jgi:hypothetical protein
MQKFIAAAGSFVSFTIACKHGYRSGDPMITLSSFHRLGDGLGRRRSGSSASIVSLTMGISTQFIGLESRVWSLGTIQKITTILPTQDGASHQSRVGARARLFGLRAMRCRNT